MPICPRVCMEQLGSHWTGFHEIPYLNVFRKSVERLRGSSKSDKYNGYYTWRPMHIFFTVSRSFLLRMRNVSDKILREKRNTRLMFDNFFRKSCHLWDNVEKYRAGQATDDNIAHALCMPYTLPMATNAHSEYVIFIMLFQFNNGCTCYVICILPVLLEVSTLW